MTKNKVIAWQVCSIRKVLKYLHEGRRRAPVRAWIDIKEAERFSKQTGRQIILRLKFDEKEAKKLGGHKGKAVYIEIDYPIKKWLQIEHLDVTYRQVDKSS